AGVDLQLLSARAPAVDPKAHARVRSRVETGLRWLFQIERAKSGRDRDADGMASRIRGRRVRKVARRGITPILKSVDQIIGIEGKICLRMDIPRSQQKCGG